MTVEEIRGENENYEQFPVGLRVLAVDDNPTCLKLLETLLRKCQYNVTTSSQARAALKMLRENKDRFDLVISDVHMPDMDGFRLLELVGLEMDLPVIMLSGNSDPKNVMKGVTHGACDYLVKPVRLEELRNIWQHVLRRKKFDSKNPKKSNDQGQTHQAGGEGCGSPLPGNTDQNAKFHRKRKDEEDESEDNGNESDSSTQKKPRVVWSIELHRKFVAAVNQLGIEKAVPKRILDLMNDDRLTRENKYRLYLKRISSVAATQQANMVASPFMRMGSLDGLGDFRTLAGSGRLGNVALPFTTGGMLGRLNSPANVNLRNFTPSSLVQHSQPQNLTNSIPSLGKVHPLLSPASQNPSLFQGIPSGLELDQLQQTKGVSGIPNFNTMDDSRMFPTPGTFTDPGTAIGSSTNLASFNAESFNVGISGSSNLLDPGRCNDNWQNTIESSKMQPNSLLSTPFHSQLPRDNNSLNTEPYLQNNPFEDSREGLIGDFHNMNQAPSQRWGEQRQSYPQGSTNTFGSLNSHIPANGIVPPVSRSLDQNSGIFNQKIDMFVNGRSSGGGSNLFQQNENEKSQGGFVPQSCDSLDELVNAMIKREQDEIVPNCDFGFDDYSFGPSI
ncbi:hypothetical protein BUALT_Bualt16G0085100 [Buddleja alternifolia]|uniref:Two-component response regulator n=1 Tax=Buddleja alternifolia TaxID=168488 RepID=A0AAV6WFH6_9LAMI|nr:hypothetical protein BUALT_Bualt16G0085100 [Buddleja alternifolia]